jgi:archaellum component FlaC
MSLEKWDWDRDEDDGYNYTAALETTLINFKIIEEDKACSMDDCRKFSKKWNLRFSGNLIKMIINLQTEVGELKELINEQSTEIYNLRQELEKHVDEIDDEIREVRNELSQDINQLEGSIDCISDSVSGSLDDFGSEIADLRHDVDKNTNEISDITSNLADRVLLD